MVTRWALLVSAAFLVPACGTHGDVPMTYGEDGVQRPLAYGAPANTPALRDPELQQVSSAPVQTQRIQSPQRLQPVSAVYLSEEAKHAPASQAGPKRVTVQPGDTVYALGRRYHVSPQSIIAENRLKSPFLLDVGQVLKMPEEARVAKAAPAKPVERKVVARDTLYRVQEGDTLYSISRRSGVAVKTIAQANRMLPPYALSEGQQLLLPQARTDSALYAANSKAGNAHAAPQTTTARAPESVAEIAKNVSYKTTKPTGSFFEWPVKGNVVASFGAVELGRRNDGINIAAPTGSPVRAAADGEVVYRGSELEGFGNLLLIKHADGYVTAYAHNDAMLVKKGDWVHQGQVIAKVGETGSVSTPQLHFEIRQNLKSIDPAALLSAN